MFLPVQKPCLKQKVLIHDILCQNVSSIREICSVEIWFQPLDIKEYLRVMPNLQPPMQRGQRFMMPQYMNKQSINSMAYRTWGGIIVSIEPISNGIQNLRGYHCINRTYFKEAWPFADLFASLQAKNTVCFDKLVYHAWQCRRREPILLVVQGTG